MIPLRVVAVDTLGLPEGSKRGTIMDIERAVLLFLLEPDTLYYPNDIALLAFTWELQQGPLNAAQSKQLKRHRSAFSQMAVHAGLGSAVQLSGRTWAGLVKAARPELAKFMKHLADTQANQPGVIFTLFEGQLIPYPDQGASTAPPLPPCGRNITRIMEFPVAEAFQPVAPELREEAAVATATDAVAALPACLTPRPSTKTKARRRFWPPRWSLIRHLGQGWLRSLLLVLCVPSLLFAYFWVQVDEFSMDQIEEMGAPFQEVPHLVVAGKRHEPGDWVRIEGEVGMIKKISREAMMVGDRTYLAPTLTFFGQRMNVSGNFVVYPGNPRHIAGNFWLDHSDALEKMEPGYLSWLGGFARGTYVFCRFSDASPFCSAVLGIPVKSTGDIKIMIPNGTQLEDLLDGCESSGAKIKQDTKGLEVVWP